MIKTDKYIKETIQEILESGSRDQNPRPKNSKRKIKDIDKIFQFTNNTEFKISEYFNKNKVDIIILDSGVVLHDKTISDIRRKRLKNPFSPTVYEKGFLGNIKKTNISNKKEYHVWIKMLQRCYDEEFHKKQPSYIGCSVAEEWHNFQNFAHWFEENYNNVVMQTWHLDKDILIKGNKIYSPETCCFVPHEINCLFTKRQNKRGDCPVGVAKNNKGYTPSVVKNNLRIYLGYFKTPEEAFQTYKRAKEEYIKEVADRWKEQIDLRVYEAMYNYQIEITD